MPPPLIPNIVGAAALLAQAKGRLASEEPANAPPELPSAARMGHATTSRVTLAIVAHVESNAVWDKHVAVEDAFPSTLTSTIVEAAATLAKEMGRRAWEEPVNALPEPRSAARVGHATTCSSNCGACGKACASGSACCNGSCVAIDDSPNCGRCSNKCLSGTSCHSGRCILIVPFHEGIYPWGVVFQFPSPGACVTCSSIFLGVYIYITSPD